MLVLRLMPGQVLSLSLSLSRHHFISRRYLMTSRMMKSSSSSRSSNNNNNLSSEEREEDSYNTHGLMLQYSEEWTITAGTLLHVLSGVDTVSKGRVFTFRRPP
ncbi:hypothetical protein MPTK1_6g09750 [Marchantia polymorpha subsp. ruderalis]